MGADVVSILGNLFGGSETGKEIVSQVGNAFDELIHTDQEEAEEKAQARREGYQVFMSWLESTSGSRIARRIIALVVTGIWALLFIMTIITRTAAAFADELATIDKLMLVSSGFSTDAQEIAPLVGVVLLFYFGGPAAIDGVKGLVAKWTSKQ